MLVLARDKQLRRYAFFESYLFETHVQHFMCDSGLHYVCGLGDTQVVEAMIDCGAEITTRKTKAIFAFGLLTESIGYCRGWGVGQEGV